jgi:hypothetical protein
VALAARMGLGGNRLPLRLTWIQNWLRGGSGARDGVCVMIYLLTPRTPRSPASGGEKLALTGCFRFNQSSDLKNVGSLGEVQLCRGRRN